MRPIQFEDIITTEKPKLVTISHDGTKVAFAVERSNIEENNVTDTLYIWDQKSGSATALLTLESVKKILWVQDANYVLGQKEKEFQIYRIENGVPTLMVSSWNPISTFAAINHNKYTTLRLSAVLRKPPRRHWKRDMFIDGAKIQ
jgi:hypothetical protein